MSAIERAIGQLDRGQRDRLRALAIALHLTADGYADVFAALIDAVDAADGAEAYVIRHVCEQVWPEAH